MEETARRLHLASTVGFHTADLTYLERRLVEDAFRSGEARALVATTTLSMGINWQATLSSSPTRPDTRRCSADGGDRTSWCRSTGTRPGGRLGKRTAGFSILLADNTVEQRQLVNAVVIGD